jgi:hypothetical protein
VSESTEREQTGALAHELEATGMGPAALASIGSVALALYYYYVRGEKQRGQFVGLWPATILAFAAYLRLSRIERLLSEGEE